MKGKKILSLFCAAALTLSLAACGSKTSDYSGQTITGEITDINGTAVTMQLGELSEGGMPSDSGQTPPDKPDGETQSGNSSSQDHASSDSSQPPAKPDSQSGSADSQLPEMPRILYCLPLAAVPIFA